MPQMDREKLAYDLSTVTVDLSLPGEPVKWGHLSSESCVALASFIEAWLAITLRDTSS